MNCEIPYVQAGFRKGRRTRDQIAIIHWIIEKAREFQKYTYFCFVDHVKAFDTTNWITTNCGKLTEIGIPDHLACLLRYLYAGQEAIVTTEHGTADWFQIKKGVIKAVYCHPAYLNYMLSTSCEMPNWMKHKLDSWLLGEISITSDMQKRPLSWQNVKRN